MNNAWHTASTQLMLAATIMIAVTALDSGTMPAALSACPVPGVGGSREEHREEWLS